MTPGEFATIGRYHDAIGAEMARAKLEAAGITAHLADEATVSIDWQLTNALGGIRLLVPRDDASAATEILREAPPTDAQAAGEIAEALTPKEQRAERAAKMAIFGCMFAPLMVYAAWLVVRALTEPGKLRPNVNRQFKFAMALTALVPLAMAFFLVLIFSN